MPPNKGAPNPDLRVEEGAKDRGHHGTSRISMKALKRFALEKLPDHSPLRTVLISEDDEISASEFVGAAKVWLALLRHARSG